MRARVDLAAIAENGGSQSLQVLQRMELSLARKAKCRAGMKSVNRCSVDQLDIEQAGTVCSFHFLLEIFPFAVRTEEEISVDALEVAIDVLL